MVFFQCAGCGTDCKKNQVEKHKVQCRRSEVFSCIDCSVEFRGQAYSSHTRCMTESQKYEAKNSAAAMGSGMSKGDAKQEAWLNKINQAVADSASQSDKRVTKVLEKLPDYPNIPRKRAKLINFLKSSLRVNDPQVCEAVWDFLEKATVPAPAAEITTAAVGEEKAKEEEVKREETEEKAQGGGEMDIDKDVATTNGAGAGEGEKKKKKKKKDKSAEAGEEKKTTAVENGAETPQKEKTEGKKEKKKKKENKKVETAGAGEAEAKPTEETKKISETKEEDTPTSIEAEEEEQKSDEREEKIGKAKKRKMSENATETEEAGKKKKKKGKVNGTAEVKEGETAVVTHTIVESSGVTGIDGEGKRKKKKGKKNQGESQDDTVVIHSFVVMDTDATIPAVADLTMDAKVDDKSVAEKVKTPEVSNPTDSGTKKQKKKKKKTTEEKESGSDKENAPSPKEEKKGKKKKGKTGNVTNGVEKGKNNETAVVDKSADLPVPTTKEDVKLVKKLKRKKRREEELAAGITKVKKEKKEVKEGESVPDKPDAGKAGKKKSKSKDAVKPDQGESASPTKNKKGKRFDIGRVIHSFLDACPTKKASFTEVTAKVLEEFKRVKFQPDMEEKNLMNKINKKIELNPNINIKNGEIILV